MPYYVIDRISEALNERKQCVNGAKILILGVAYKKDIDDDRESPSYTIMRLLSERGALIHYNDPHIPRLKAGRKNRFLLESLPLTEETLAEMDAVVILTDHSTYDYGWIVRHARMVIDTRNATRDVTEGRERIVKA